MGWVDAMVPRECCAQAVPSKTDRSSVCIRKTDIDYFEHCVKMEERSMPTEDGK